MSNLNKFGCTTNADSGVATDVWDGANPTDDTDIWLAPTAARIHAVASTDAGDTALGAGARTVRIYGLIAWNKAETSEAVILNGTTPVNTNLAYVCIHRMQVTSTGATSANIGDITATAATDGTVTAEILATKGQTLMAVYAISKGYRLDMNNYYAGILKGSGAANGVADVTLLQTINVEKQPAIFQVKHFLGLSINGSTELHNPFDPPFQVFGPAIVKIQVATLFANGVVMAGFNGNVEQVLADGADPTLE